jgi:hypothetical protein
MLGNVKPHPAAEGGVQPAEACSLAVCAGLFAAYNDNPETT